MIRTCVFSLDFMAQALGLPQGVTIAAVRQRDNRQMEMVMVDPHNTYPENCALDLVRPAVFNLREVELRGSTRAEVEARMQQQSESPQA